ncbi:MAG: Rv3235 family protein, partial [Frankiaceae bacterium]|nr:Rv3235 family protein [Frankiaceae bacterium]
PRAVPADEDAERERTPADLLPPARPVAHALVQGLLEVLAGVRPVSQLQRSTTPELFAQLELAVHAHPRSTGARPVTGAVRSLHVQERPEGVAEVCATVRRGQRMSAVALRLEGLSGRWTCTQLTCV